MTDDDKARRRALGAERARRFRESKKRSGLVEVKCWVHEEDRDAMHAYAELLNKRREK